MTGGSENPRPGLHPDGDAGAPPGDEEARLAAVLALLALARRGTTHGTAPGPQPPLARWRATRMAALRAARD